VISDGIPLAQQAGKEITHMKLTTLAFILVGSLASSCDAGGPDPAPPSPVAPTGPCATTDTPPSDKDGVCSTVMEFYAAFDAAFAGPADFATEDWNHINPTGGWTRGRESVLAEVRAVHAGLLRGVTDTVEDTSVRFATSDVAVVTVTSRVSNFVAPDGVAHNGERNRRTFVVLRSGRWLVTQDQNTVVLAGVL
jgi:uncharacterized protein (TIGR02246 family)